MQSYHVFPSCTYSCRCCGVMTAFFHALLWVLSIAVDGPTCRNDGWSQHGIHFDIEFENEIVCTRMYLHFHLQTRIRICVCIILNMYIGAATNSFQNRKQACSFSILKLRAAVSLENTSYVWNFFLEKYLFKKIKNKNNLNYKSVIWIAAWMKVSFFLWFMLSHRDASKFRLETSRILNDLF